MAERGHGQLTNIITSQLERALAPDIGLSVVGEGGETIQFFKDSQIKLSRLDTVETTESLIMAVKATNDHLDRIVGLGDEPTFNSIDQFGPMMLQEIENSVGLRVVLDKMFPPSHDLEIAFVSGPLSFGLENTSNLLAELEHLRLSEAIIRAIEAATGGADILQGMEDTFVMDGLGKDPDNIVAVVLAQVGDDDPRLITFGVQGQQKGLGTGFVLVGIDSNVQQVIGISIHSQVNVHPTTPLAGRFVIFGHQNKLFINSDHPTGFDQTEQGRYWQQVRTPSTDPTIGSGGADTQSLAGATVGAVTPTV